jgi:hypothetical protein
MRFRSQLSVRIFSYLGPDNLIWNQGLLLWDLMFDIITGCHNGKLFLARDPTTHEGNHFSLRRGRQLRIRSDPRVNLCRIPQLTAQDGPNVLWCPTGSAAPEGIRDVPAGKV